MDGESLAKGLGEGLPEGKGGEDLDLGHPAEEEAFESAAFGDEHFDDEAVELAILPEGSFDLALGGMEGALGEDAGDDAIGLQADADGHAVKAIEAVIGEELREGEVGWAFEGLASFAEREDVVDREGGDHHAAMVKADDLEGRPIGIEVDGIGLKDPVAALAAVEGLVAHRQLLLVEGGIGQLVDEGAVAGVVLGGHRRAAKDGREGFEFGLEGSGEGGTHLLEQGAAVLAERGAEGGEADAGDRLLGEDEGGQLTGRQGGRGEGGVAQVLVEHLPPLLFRGDRVVAHQLIEIAADGDVIDPEDPGEFGLGVRPFDKEEQNLDEALGEGATVGFVGSGRSSLEGHGHIRSRKGGRAVLPWKRLGSVPGIAARRGERADWPTMDRVAAPAGPPMARGSSEEYLGVVRRPPRESPGHDADSDAAGRGIVA